MLLEPSLATGVGLAEGTSSHIGVEDSSLLRLRFACTMIKLVVFIVELSAGETPLARIAVRRTR